MRLLVISHALTQRPAQARWRKLAAAYPDMHVRLLIPRRWRSRHFESEVVFEGQEETDGRFEVRCVDVSNETDGAAYYIRDFNRQLRDLEPDVIFPVHESNQTLQTVVSRKTASPRSRLVFFTMSALPRVTPFFSLNPSGRNPLVRNLKRLLLYWRYRSAWWIVCHGTDAVMCHYPGIRQQVQSEGYRRPVFIQTQIGVDEDVFYPDPAQRAAVRAELGLDGFVLGFAGQVRWEKGIREIAQAMRRLPNDVRFLAIGDGTERSEVEAVAARDGWRDRLHITGYVSLNQVARLMRAMDCFVLGSRTTPTSIDTFPLVVAQAMATNLPVVGSDCGGIPYQLGDLGLVFREGDAEGLAAHVRTLYDDAELRSQMGSALRQRALQEFCTVAMNAKLRDFLISLTGSS